MLKERIATGAVLLSVFLFLIYSLSTRQFAVVVAAVVAIGTFEWAGLAKASRRTRLSFSALCTSVFVWVIWAWQAIDPSRPEIAALYALAALFWIFAAPVCLARGTRIGSSTALLGIGVLVVVPAGFAVIGLHYVGPEALLMILALVWIADIAAYFSGRAFGKHKLAPSISPSKTWEGVAGALVATLVYAIACALIWPQLGSAVRERSWVLYLAVAALLCAVSIVGDLFESLVKRQAAVKDSGTLLPGHGGVLDRIDSLSATLPVAAWLFYLVVGGLV